LLDHKHRRPYWLETRRLMLFVILSLMGGLTLVLMFMGWLDTFTIVGFPVGYFLLAHGFIIAAFVGFVWHGHEQDHIDHRHGTHEDI